MKWTAITVGLAIAGVITILFSLYLGIAFNKPAVIVILPTIIGLFFVAVPLAGAFTLVWAHELGHWLCGRLCGLRLHAIAAWPVYIRLVPSLKIELKRSQCRTAGAIWMWPEDGVFRFWPTVWMLFGGSLANAAVGVAALEVGLHSANPLLAQWLYVLAGCSLFLMIMNLSPLRNKDGSTNPNDGAFLHLLFTNPDHYSRMEAITNHAYLQANGVPGHCWPYPLIDRLYHESNNSAQNYWIYTMLIYSSTGDAYRSAIATKRCMYELAGWSASDSENNARLVQVCLVLAAHLQQPSTALTLLPAPDGLSPKEVVTRNVAVAAILYGSGKMNSAKQVLTTVEDSLRGSFFSNTEKNWFTANIQPLQRRISWAAENKLFYEVSAARASGVRPRDLDPKWIEGLSKIAFDHKDRGFSLVVQLEHAIDSGRFDDADVITGEFLRWAPFVVDQARYHVANVNCIVATFYSLYRGDFKKGKKIFARQRNSVGANRDVKLLAEASLAAVDGKLQLSLAKINELEGYYNNLPEWFAVDDMTKDQIAMVRDLCQKRSVA